jgi:DNA-binding transcriptional regulator YiaG
MPSNIATALKSEIVRLARKEIRTQTQSLRTAAARYRAEIRALRQRADALEEQLRRLGRSSQKQSTRSAAADGDANAKSMRFSAKGLASLRRKLGISASEAGLLIGVSAQSIYNWEAGSVKPHAEHLPAIASLRQMGKRAAAARIDELRAAG